MAKRVSKPLVGLDIEPSAVTAAQVSVNGSITIDRAAIVPLEAGVVRDGEVADVEALAEALRTLYRENKGLDKRVRIGIANAKIVVRTIELPPISDRKELETAVRFHAQDHIPMPLDAAVLDWQPLDVVDTPGARASASCSSRRAATWSTASWAPRAPRACGPRASISRRSR